MSILERAITDSSAYNAFKGVNILTVVVFSPNGSSCAPIRYGINDSGFIVIEDATIVSIMPFFRFALNLTGSGGETPFDDHRFMITISVLQILFVEVIFIRYNL